MLGSGGEGGGEAVCRGRPPGLCRGSWDGVLSALLPGGTPSLSVSCTWLWDSVVAHSVPTGPTVPETLSVCLSLLLLVSCCFYCPLSLIHVTRGLLNGAGDVGFAFINGVAEVVGRIGFALLLVNFTSLGLCSIWLTTCLTWTLTGIMCVLRYKAGIWRKKAEITINKN